MSSKKKTFNNRENDEREEGYKTIQTDLPSGRFQGEKQFVTADQMGVTAKSKPDNVSNIGDSAAKELKSKIKVRPDVSVEDLGGKQVGGVPLAVETGLRNAAGARTMSTADDMSRTPYTPGNYRPETRYGKKRSEDLFELDNAAIEQVVPQVEDLDDLRKAPDKEVGYNGRQQFKQTRQKKNFTFTPDAQGADAYKLPQQLLNEASVDFVDMDQVVYTSGQVCGDLQDNGTVGIPATADYPILAENDMRKGNYMPITLNVTMENGHVTGIDIAESKYLVHAAPVVKDQANTNWQIDANNVAKTMVRMQAEMGRETTDKWTPLAYVIHNPYEYNMLMHDIEASTGAIMATAYRSAVSGLAYQRNIVKKDGINPQRNAIKMVTEGFAGVLADNDRNTIADLNFDDMIWNRNAYRAGSAAAIIAMFDSTAKYRTKADLLGLQRSFGLHLSQADNNINPLHCKPEFIKALDKAHMFSTIDGKYNPYLPIYQTKKIKIINPLSLNQFLKGWVNPALMTTEQAADPRRNTETGTYSLYQYEYNDLRKNRYVTNVQHPVIEGLLRWILKHEGAFVRTYGGNGREVVARIPFSFDMQCPSMLSFMLCSAAQDVAFARNITFRDILFAGEQSNYIWDDLAGLDKLNPLYSSQLRINKYDEPLELGKLAIDSALRCLYSDHMQLSDHDTHGQVQYYAPWYFNEQAFAADDGSGRYSTEMSFFDDNTPFNASFPSIREGVRHEYVDLIKSVEPKDVLLAMDRKLDILPFTEVSNGSEGWFTFRPIIDGDEINAKVSIGTVRYDGNSDGRIVIKYDLNAGSDLDLNALGFYCIPKEIGYIDDSYTGITVISSVTSDGDHDNPSFAVTSYNDSFNSIDTSGVNTNYYNGGKAYYITSYRVEQDSDAAASIDRAAALTSTFYRFFAANGNTAIRLLNTEFVAQTGLVVARAAGDDTEQDVVSIFDVKSNVPSTHVMDDTVRTNAAFIWTALQRYISPINPFANAFSVGAADHSFDPCEVCFWFGVCGFLAADYTQMVLERLSYIDQLGMDYTEDPNFKSSLIFR